MHTLERIETGPCRCVYCKKQNSRLISATFFEQPGNIKHVILLYAEVIVLQNIMKNVLPSQLSL